MSVSHKEERTIREMKEQREEGTKRRRRRASLSVVTEKRELQREKEKRGEEEEDEDEESYSNSLFCCEHESVMRGRFGLGSLLCSLSKATVQTRHDVQVACFRRKEPANYCKAYGEP